MKKLGAAASPQANVHLASALGMLGNGRGPENDGSDGGG